MGGEVGFEGEEAAIAGGVGVGEDLGDMAGALAGGHDFAGAF